MPSAWLDAVSRLFSAVSCMPVGLTLCWILSIGKLETPGAKPLQVARSGLLLSSAAAAACLSSLPSAGPEL